MNRSAFSCMAICYLDKLIHFEFDSPAEAWCPNFESEDFGWVLDSDVVYNKSKCRIYKSNVNNNI